MRRRLFLGLPLLTACGKLVPRTQGPPARAKAPPFALPSCDGEVYSLDRLKKRGPAVVVFYRGFW